MMNNKLKTVVVDYSDTQRHLITHLVESHKNLELLAVFECAEEAAAMLEISAPDLLLLDIEMPQLNGFRLLESLEPRTQVILITSNPDYALRAFDIGVTDYLLKPVRALRFEQAIRKAVLNNPKNRGLEAEIPSLHVKSDHEIKRIAIPDIRWIEATGDYVKIITNRERILVLSTMKAIEEELPKDKFLRIHRSYIVNLKKVDNFSSTSVEVEGIRLPMSRKRKTELEDILWPMD